MLIAQSADLLLGFEQTLQDKFPTASFSNIADNRGFVLEFSGPFANRIWIENRGSSLEDVGWEKPEITFIKSYFCDNYYVYSIAYHSIDTVKKVIVLLADSDQILVDNDCGTLMPGPDFIRKVRLEPDWYWFDDLK